MNYDDLRRRSAKAIWHPYTEMTSFEQLAFPIVDHAEGCTLYTVEGRPLLDGISSWWCVNLGHGHPRLVEAIQDQAGRLQHTLLGGMSHPRAIELAERLAGIVPGLGHTMFGADGSLAVEAALKIALQYWVNRGETKRTRFISLADGYHGDTLGAVGVGIIEAFHKPFLPAIHPAWRAASPHCNRCPVGCHPETCHTECFASMESLVHEHHAECAAVIVEPLCQAAAGMRIYPAEYLRRLRALCDDFGLPLIADEVAVGFGRTGAMFACELAGIRPDILTLGKGLTGGMLPMSATLVTDVIYDTFHANGGKKARPFFHGTTFCGNPITSAVALAALDVYEEEHIVESLTEPAHILAEGMIRVAKLLDSPARTLGMIAAIEIADSAGGCLRARQITRHAAEMGLLIRPLGSTIYLLPPLNARELDLHTMIEILTEAATPSCLPE